MACHLTQPEISREVSLGVNLFLWPGIEDFSYVDEYLEINAFFRYYPTGISFFLGTGLGYYHFFNYPISVTERRDGNYTDYIGVDGFVITPQIGWKLDGG